MKKKDVAIGRIYRAKVGRNLANVKLLSERADGGWNAINLDTNRTIYIKTAQRLRCEVHETLQGWIQGPEPKLFDINKMIRERQDDELRMERLRAFVTQRYGYPFWTDAQAAVDEEIAAMITMHRDRGQTVSCFNSDCGDHAIITRPTISTVRLQNAWKELPAPKGHEKIHSSNVQRGDKYLCLRIHGWHAVVPSPQWYEVTAGDDIDYITVAPNLYVVARRVVTKDDVIGAVKDANLAESPTVEALATGMTILDGLLAATFLNVNHAPELFDQVMNEDIDEE